MAYRERRLNCKTVARNERNRAILAPILRYAIGDTRFAMTHEWQRDGYTISTDRSRIDLNVVLDYLQNQAYWAQGRPRDVIERSIQHSENFGVYRGDAQVGFARVVTDYATFAYVCDVFILPSEQGHGLGKWLMESMLSHPELQGLRMWYLRTRDAHGLYQQFGFTELIYPERSMERPGNL
jgi:GNAT superfamily N-acetyltransferase